MSSTSTSEASPVTAHRARSPATLAAMSAMERFERRRTRVCSTTASTSRLEARAPLCFQRRLAPQQEQAVAHDRAGRTVFAEGNLAPIALRARSPLSPPVVDWTEGAAPDRWSAASTDAGVYGLRAPFLAMRIAGMVGRRSRAPALPHPDARGSAPGTGWDANFRCRRDHSWYCGHGPDSSGVRPVPSDSECPGTRYPASTWQASPIWTR